MGIGAISPHWFPPGQMMVGIRVLDINDNDPVLLNLPMNLTLSENTPVSSFVTRILARDADKGPNALLTFDITSGNTENAFYINSTVWHWGWWPPCTGGWDTGTQRVNTPGPRVLPSLGTHGCHLACCLRSPCPGRRCPSGSMSHIPCTYFLPFFSLERHHLRKPPAGPGAGGRVQADCHGEGQPREHPQCQAGNYGHCPGLQQCKQQGGWEKGLLPWPEPGGAFTHRISNRILLPQKYLGVTRLGLQPPENRTSRI